MDTAPLIRAEASPAPAVVLGSGVTAVGVVRSLRERGVDTFLAAREGIATRSRGITLVPDVVAAKTSRSKLRELLAASGIGTGVLVPCDDDWVRAVIDSWDDIQGSFPATIPGPSVIEQLIDKDAFARTMERVGIPHPRTFEVRSIEDLDPISDTDLPSFFLKPCDSQRFTRRFRQKAFQLEDREGARRMLEVAVAEGHGLLAQERVPGPPERHVFIDGYRDRHGDVLGILARRRLRMYPPGFGNSTDSVTIPLSEARDAVDSALTLFEEIGFHGMFDAEFKLDERSGRHTIIEVNARPWWQIELSRAAGIDVAWMAYADALGQPAPAAEGYRVGRRWVHTFPDLRARWEGGVASDPGIAKESWFAARHAVVALDDPGPGLGEFARVALVGSRMLVRRLARVSARLRSRRSRDTSLSPDDPNPR